MSNKLTRVPDREMQALIDNLNPARSKRQNVKQRPKAKPQTGFLIAAILVIIGGAGYTIYQSLTPTPEQASEPEGDSTQATANPQQASSASGGYAGGGGGVQFKPTVYGNNLRPAWVMDQLPLPPSLFVSIDNLPTPTKDRPVEVYVLLYSMLDRYTEQMWMQRGLLNEDGPALNPFVRKVKLTDADAVNYLIDWHVESAAVIPPAAQH